MPSSVALLRLEGAAVLAVATWGYAVTGASWWTVAALLFVPDVSMVGYLGGPSVGARAYNAGHTIVAPAVLAGASAALGWGLGVPVAWVWAAHIGLDRALGYGLKLDDVHHTHLGPIGPARRA